ncbi:MAG TPA: hypothetical protein VJ779_11235 [Acetobacteraceae bacterium]|jgi:hypothetical protein|nr:hypothetical protein [Acetobacteraceae bacterium]
METVIRLVPHRKDNVMRIGIRSSRGGGALSQPGTMAGHPGPPRVELASPSINEALT